MSSGNPRPASLPNSVLILSNKLTNNARRSSRFPPSPKILEIFSSSSACEFIVFSTFSFIAVCSLTTSSLIFAPAVANSLGVSPLSTLSKAVFTSFFSMISVAVYPAPASTPSCKNVLFISRLRRFFSTSLLFKKLIKLILISQR